MKNIVLFFFIMSAIISCDSNRNVSETVTGQNTKQMTKDYEDRWIYFDLPEPIEITVIDHASLKVHCGTVAVASVTIGYTEAKDTLRIFDLCNLKDFAKGEKIIITPAKRPGFNVAYPTFHREDKDGKLLPHPNNVDVLKTTYGSIERKQ